MTWQTVLEGIKFWGPGDGAIPGNSGTPFSQADKDKILGVTYGNGGLISSLLAGVSGRLKWFQILFGGLLIAQLGGVATAEGERPTGTDPRPVQYLKFFLDSAPSVTDRARAQLPPSARDIISAKVRVVQRPSYLAGPDQSGYPAPPPKDLFFARIKIVDAIEGSASPGEQLDVWFGIPGRSRGHKVPRLPAQTARDYFVLLYLDDDEKRRLAAFPIDEREYEEWWKEFLIYDRERSRPGAHDR